MNKSRKFVFSFLNELLVTHARISDPSVSRRHNA